MEVNELANILRLIKIKTIHIKTSVQLKKLDIRKIEKEKKTRRKHKKAVKHSGNK